MSQDVSSHQDTSDQHQDTSAQPSFSLDFAYAHGTPLCEGDFRTEPEDFCVTEHLGFPLLGSGEHVYLNVKKVGENTHWVARRIAELAGVREMDVGYGGKKDRHAVTTQWFSVYMPKATSVDWQALNSSSVTLLNHTRHSAKLRRGDHAGNTFNIRLRNLSSIARESQSDSNYHISSGDWWQAVELRMNAILEQGVPNYFGEQRFGRGGANLVWAQRWLVDGEKIRDRQKRSMTLSAARSYLFNRVLSDRIDQGTWHQWFEGDVPVESGSGGISQSPTGPLWGRGRPLSSGQVVQWERQSLSSLKSWCDALEHQGLSQERRRLCLLPEEFQWQREENDLVLQFGLLSGEYATSVLREIARLKERSKAPPVI
ncbi:tRNA pseudouridine(13) synthase TruD [Marinibactrum halimedae]|uniref:tRNA pseudouridine synthase D n=1 Tax=Marinibactrum halimedae TaxID=1444977 RepID=A0AA37T5K5_9GAMM|nr:tRNA pseudouridine(13) synthase TruD [Marinibactrum halimedae]MCD9458624.1 tRNA pseudouridine(13) synthase TruD [Marinibactrum halimedae]GLS26011.1 tRNA pseudouridine synthase D [Marinibactrum halimedae]